MMESRPTPLSMPRRQAVPAFTGQLRYNALPPFPRRGRDGVTAVSDTGVLIGVSLRESVLELFAEYFRGRLLLTQNVFKELEKFAKGANTIIGPAAARALAILVDRDHAEIAPLTPDDLVVFDEVRLQLANMDSSERPIPLLKHAGEAESIAVAQRLQTTGEHVVLLTNDKSASRVATSRGIYPLHFGQVVRQLVCKNMMTMDEAFELSEISSMVTGIKSFDKPGDPSYFTCYAVDGQCATCDA